MALKEPSVTNIEPTVRVNVHDEFFKEGIWTKSMVNTYLSCPIKFEQRYIKGIKSPPGFATVIGLTMHDLLEVWGIRKIKGLPLNIEEAVQTLHDNWAARSENLEGEEKAKAVKEKDGKILKLSQLYQKWTQRVDSFGLGRLRGVETLIGADKTVPFGGAHLAGHIDCEWDIGPGDYKVVSQRSRYRRPDPYRLELILYGVLTGKSTAALFPMVHDFVRPNDKDIEMVDMAVTQSKIDMAEEVVGRVVEAVSKGSFPPNPEIGKGLCQRKYCGYFGTTCPVTKGL